VRSPFDKRIFELPQYPIGNGRADGVIDKIETGGNSLHISKLSNNLREQRPFRWWQIEVTEPKKPLLDSWVSPSQLNESGHKRIIPGQTGFIR
jgi:hypothetical protein